MTPSERKKHSIQQLEQEGIPFIRHLPEIEDATEIFPRSTKEIAERFVACYLTLQVTCDLLSDKAHVKLSRQAFGRQLYQFGLANQVTPKERAIFEGCPGKFAFYRKNPNRQELSNMFWKHEALWVLFWALGFIDTLDFPAKERCNSDYSAMHAVMSSCSTMKELIEQVTLRDTEQLLDETDLIYRYHWACRHPTETSDSHFILNSDVVLERHRALNWLVGKDRGYDNWDCIPTDS